MSESLNFKLEIFEGPLDLLLSLISKNKVDIYDIPISLILDQYLEYLEDMRRMDMDIAGEFITMASELMLIKSRMLLPKSPLEEDIDPRERLAQALIEYKRAKEAAVMLMIFNLHSFSPYRPRQSMKMGICFSQDASEWLPPGTTRSARFTRLVRSKWDVDISATAFAAWLYISSLP